MGWAIAIVLAGIIGLAFDNKRYRAAMKAMKERAVQRNVPDYPWLMVPQRVFVVSPGGNTTVMSIGKFTVWKYRSQL